MNPEQPNDKWDDWRWLAHSSLLTADLNEQDKALLSSPRAFGLQEEFVRYEAFKETNSAFRSGTTGAGEFC